MTDLEGIYKAFNLYLYEKVWQFSAMKTKQKTNVGDLGKFLQTARESRGLTQADIARKFGFTTPQPVSDWERNKGSGVPAHVFGDLVQMLGVSFDKAYVLLVEFHKKKLEQKLQKKFAPTKKKTIRIRR